MHLQFKLTQGFYLTFLFDILYFFSLTLNILLPNIKIITYLLFSIYVSINNSFRLTMPVSPAVVPLNTV